jgi:CRP/FNR family transcriptional regulator
LVDYRDAPRKTRIATAASVAASWNRGQESGIIRNDLLAIKHLDAMSAPENGKIFRLHDLQRTCQQCSLQMLCLPGGLSDGEMERLDNIIQKRRPLQRGEHLYHVGDDLEAIYAVRSGSIKSYTITPDGEEQIVGFHLPGELLGLDAIGDGHHPAAAKALETTSVCELPFERLEQLAHDIPELQHQLLRMMSSVLKSDESIMTLLGKKTSEERLAAFLISIANRFAQRGYSDREFNLSMSRNDIANYLGLAMETISRLFSRFQEQGLIEAERKLVRILDKEGLRRLAGNLPRHANNSGAAKEG